jgi:actin related protein 2/3 complex, subunit 1A/1B
MSSSKGIARAISCFCYNADGSQCAISPNSNVVEIYDTNKSTDSSTWTKTATLDEHGGWVSAIDWSPVSNEIVTCGHDRNAYVWKLENGEWKPELVLLRINRAATMVKWSPDGKKFAVGSGAKVVPVCHYEDENKWWVSKLLKKHSSTVLDVSWSPNSKFVVTGCCDGKARIMSAYINGLDSSEDDGFGAVFAKQHKFGAVLGEFGQAGGWVEGVHWSDAGFRIAFTGHGSTVHVIQLLADGPPTVSTVYCQQLPFTRIRFVDDNTLVASGYDNNPTIFKANGSNWEFSALVDKHEAKKAADSSSNSAFANARKAFASATSRGQDASKTSATKLNTKHQNTITDLQVTGAGIIATSGIDGQLFTWDLNALGLL